MKTRALVLLVVIASLVSGCSTVARAIRPGSSAGLAEDESLVFGRVVFTKDGKELLPYGILERPAATIFNVESERAAYGLAIGGDGAFYWRLRRGTYIIRELFYRDSLQPQTVFQAPASGAAFYLGTLSVDYGISQPRIEITDDLGAAEAALVERHPGIDLPVEKNLMVHNPSIPVDPYLQTRRNLLGILGALNILIMSY